MNIPEAASDVCAIGYVLTCYGWVKSAAWNKYKVSQRRTLAESEKGTLAESDLAESDLANLEGAKKMRPIRDAEASAIQAEIEAGHAEPVSDAWFRCPGPGDAEVQFWFLGGRVLRCEYAGTERRVDVVTGEDLKLFVETYHLH